MLATTGATPAVVCAGPKGGLPSRPTFCAIPPTPTGVRSAQAFKAAVVATRKAGAALTAETGPGAFGLPEGQAEAFDRSARALVAPVGDTPAPSDTDSFSQTARREVVAPPKPRRAAPPAQ
jgi:hypothetical protein